ncbi:interleukin-1 beta-like isoform 1-T1 [Pholidichthys leucotaenia]
MDDFDLAQALEDGCCLEKNDIKIEKEDEVIKLEEGLELIVSHNGKTMKSVSNLVLVMTKMRRLIPPELRGDALCREIMEYVADETIFKPVQNSSGGKFTLHRVASMECSLTDSSQKAIILAGESKLEAITLRGGEYERKVKFKMSQYAKASHSSNDGQLVLLSIKDSLHLSCSEEGDIVILKLKKCRKEDLSETDLECFLFYKKTTGISHTTFESFKYRDWYISTSFEDKDKEVVMCQKSPSRNTCFTER